MNKLEIKGTQEFLGVNIPVIEGGFGEGQKVMLAKTISEVHGVELRRINELINNNIDEFEFGVDILDLKNNENFKILTTNLGINVSNRTKNFYLLSVTGYAKFYTILRNKNEKILDFIINSYFNSNKIILTSLQKKEIRFLDMLEESLKPFNITGIRQYNVLGYRIDYYIPSLNIAIEYDENEHKHYSYENHEGRQKEIENELGCRFIRITDSNSHSFNVGKVIKEIFNIYGGI